MGKSATKIDKHLRVAQFVRMISNGAVNSEMTAYDKREWGLKDTQAREYIREAREVIVEDINQNRQIVVTELLHGAHTTWKKAVNDKQYNNALGAMNLITRLGGLEPK